MKSETNNSVQTTENPFEYKGKLEEQQLYGINYKNVKYSLIEYNSWNDYQNLLYNRAIHGINIYTEDELKTMRWDKRKRIMKVHKRAQLVLNIWKQEIVNKLTNKLFVTLFPKTSITQTILELENDTDPEYINTMTFKSLNISKAQIIKKLIQNNILPHNFNDLKVEKKFKLLIL